MTELTFNPARLTLARCRRGLTKVALANQVGLSARRIAAFENEGDLPPASTIQALAESLGFPQSFFFRPAPPLPSPHGVSFRSLSRLPATRRDAALAAAAIAIEITQLMETQFQLPYPDLLDLRNVEPATAALALRAAWGLGDDPTPNVIHLLESHGVRVFSLTDDCAALDSFSLWHEGTPFVFLTRHKSAERGRWDTAHELAHLILHISERRPQGREQELEADAFAAEFLLPEKGIRSSAARFTSLVEVKREKRLWRVSALAYIRRLHQLRLVTDWQYRSLVVEASQAGYRRQEGDIEYEWSQLIPKVLDLLEEEGGSLAQLSNELGVSAIELRGFLFSRLSVIDGAGNTRPIRPSRLRVLGSPQS